MSHPEFLFQAFSLTFGLELSSPGEARGVSITAFQAENLTNWSLGRRPKPERSR